MVKRRKIDVRSFALRFSDFAQLLHSTFHLKPLWSNRVCHTRRPLEPSSEQELQATLHVMPSLS